MGTTFDGLDISTLVIDRPTRILEGPPPAAGPEIAAPTGRYREVWACNRSNGYTPQPTALASPCSSRGPSGKQTTSPAAAVPPTRRRSRPARGSSTASTPRAKHSCPSTSPPALPALLDRPPGRPAERPGPAAPARPPAARGAAGDRVCESDRDALARFEFSVYTFDAAPFRRLPTGEFLADQPVAPLREVRRRDAAAAIAAAGWVVRYVHGVEELRQLRSEIQAAGVTRFSAEKL
jgi:hypothetical protein